MLSPSCLGSSPREVLIVGIDSGAFETEAASVIPPNGNELKFVLLRLRKPAYLNVTKVHLETYYWTILTSSRFSSSLIERRDDKAHKSGQR